MKSKEINKRITEADDSKKLSNGFFGGKPIFYWGWYWREVDFDDYPYRLATDETMVGFCESNKWGYDWLKVSIEDSKKLRNLIEKSLQTKLKKDFKAVNDFMQGLGATNPEFEIATDGKPDDA